MLMKKIMMKLTGTCFLILAAIGVSIFLSCNSAPSEVGVSGISLDKTEAVLELGDAVTLTARVVPADADDRSVSWTSSDTEVVTVDGNGKVSAVGKGSATVTAETADGGFTAACAVTVRVSASGISLDEGELIMNRGEQYVLGVSVSPENADGEVTFESKDTSVVTVDENGTVTAVGKGQTDVIAGCGELSAVCTVTVRVPVEGVTLSEVSATVYKNERPTLTAAVVPADADETEVEWTSSDTKVVVVDENGRLTPKGVGTARIRYSQYIPI